MKKLWTVLLVCFSFVLPASVAAQSGTVIELDEMLACEPSAEVYERLNGNERVITCSINLTGSVFTYTDACSDYSPHPDLVEVNGMAEVEEVWRKSGTNRPFSLLQRLITYDNVFVVNGEGEMLRMSRISLYTMSDGVEKGQTTIIFEAETYTLYSFIQTERSNTALATESARSETPYCVYDSPSDEPPPPAPSPTPEPSFML